MAGKQTYDYFEALLRMADCACEAAELVRTEVSVFAPDKLSEPLGRLHQMERRADVIAREVGGQLAEDFITPIEREDILWLTRELETVTDAIEDVLIGAYMLNVRAIRSEASALVGLTVDCTRELRETLRELPDFRRSKTLPQKLVGIKRLEEQSDRLYIQAVRRLYVTERDPILLSVWRELFARLERCCDACEHAAAAIRGIVMKNS